jgi:hypothetical protein
MLDVSVMRRGKCRQNTYKPLRNKSDIYTDKSQIILFVLSLIDNKKPAKAGLMLILVRDYAPSVTTSLS